MKRIPEIRIRISLLLAVVGLIVFLFSMTSLPNPADTAYAARRIEKRIERRLSMLRSRADQEEKGTLPSDMVIYRYGRDSLISWENTFPVIDDDISPRVIIPGLRNSRMPLRYPLAQISDSLEFVNLGPKWYLAQSFIEGNSRTIIGLEIKNTLDTRSYNGVNRRLHLGRNFSIKPLSYDSGSAVRIDGRPQFTVQYEVLSRSALADAGLVWIAFALLAVSAMLFLESRRTFKSFIPVALFLLLMMASMYCWGYLAGENYDIFSPVLFAGGSVLYSLGAVVIVNLAVLLLSVALYIVRSDAMGRIVGRRPAVLALLAGLASIAAITVYSYVALKSIIQNSNICLDIYNLSDISWWTVVVYASFLSMLVSIPLVIQMMQPLLPEFMRKWSDVLSVRGRVAVSLLVSVSFVSVVSSLALGKEQGRAEVWANMLAVDRDVSLEMQLKRVEPQIAGDYVISPLCFVQGTESTIQNLIAEKYLFRIAQDYNISVYVLNDDTPYAKISMCNRKVKDGVPVFENSRFLYCDLDGQPRYEGVFLYYHGTYGLARLIVELEPKMTNRDKGFVPSSYSYARYQNSELLHFRGSYAYPTKLEKGLTGPVYEGYTHFYNTVSEDEVVIISRPVTSFGNYCIEGVFVALLFFMLLSLLSMHSAGKTGQQSFYKTRITWVVMISLILALVIMATVSVFFVYERNNANLNTIMSDKIGSVQLMLQNEIKGVDDVRDIKAPVMMEYLQNVARSSGSDIILYSTDGRFIMTTRREGQDFEFIPGSRMDREAFENIARHHKRYYIRRENGDGISRYYMYAPLMGTDGRSLAIICSPYEGGETYDFERDALMHLMTIIMLFLILLFFSRFAATKILDMIFKPLGEMSGKMRTADLESPEYITYERDDEVASLVDAYNRMVTDLSESTRKLAQAERDKAWSGMARQVAHEIKNPLTPMKLQLQRLMRLKMKGEPGWQEKFDDVSRVILEHIDILTETADEFSTFARLYSQEYSEINLDELLQSEISMYDNREDISFEYFGLEGACTMGPKPQLTRVFVNLLNNAVQALELRPDGSGQGVVRVSLRNSIRDGFYDIVFEDNGPGVDEANLDKLFNPNFTTKNSGSGLGLAISRSVLERCGATIAYSRSFSLGGACFSIQYPRRSALDN